MSPVPARITSAASAISSLRLFAAARCLGRSRRQLDPSQPGGSLFGCVVLARLADAGTAHEHVADVAFPGGRHDVIVEPTPWVADLEDSFVTTSAQPLILRAGINHTSMELNVSRSVTERPINWP
jgi:hypothetical protein